MFKRIGVMMVVGPLAAGSLYALPERKPKDHRATGPIVFTEVKHDTSRPLREITPDLSEQPAEESVEPDRPANEVKQDRPIAGQAAKVGPSLPVADPVLQKKYAPWDARFAPNLGLSFDGVNSNGWAPGDPNLAVGSTQVTQWVNTRFEIWNKTTGKSVYGPVSGNTLWSNFGGPCQTNNNGDPIVQYDKLAGRWVFMQHATPSGGPYYLCLAVSTTSDATGTFNRYAFQVGTNFPDYPKLGVWPDAYYVTFDELSGGTTLSTYACALDRNSMLAGVSAANPICFQPSSIYNHLLPADLDGLNAPPAASVEYFVNLGTNSLNMWQFHVDFSNPINSTFTGPTNIPVATFTQACSGGVCIPQLDTTNTLDSLANYPMYRFAYRHFASDGHESLVLTHSVGTPSGVRWYEIRTPATPTIYQSGTFSPDSNYRWMGSAAMDSAGDIAIGYSESSSTMHPAMAFTGRLSTAAKGTMQSEKIVITGGGSEQVGNYRWDDYTALSVDPVDDCTFWYTNEYYKADSIKTWSTRIASFKFNACVPAVQVTLSPTSLTFSDQDVGTTSAPQTVTLTNGQTVALNITSIAASGDYAATNNCGNQLQAGAVCSISVTFTPIASGTRTGTLTVTDDAGNSPQTASLSGTGVSSALTISPGSLNFGNQTLSSTSAGQTITVTNAGGSNATINSLAISGNYGQTGNCSGAVLGANQSCTITVTFTPTVLATIPGAVTINDTTAGAPHVAGLTGTGVLPLTVTSSLSFASTTVGTTAPSQAVTLTNNQNSSLTLSWTASSDYAVSAGGTTPCSTTLAANAKCNLLVSFTPSLNGSIKGSMSANYNAAGSPALTSLTGTGTGGASATITFSPTSVNQGNVALGTSGSTSVTVKNTGASSVNLTSFSASSDFTVAPSGSTPCGSSLAAGKSCTETVTFSPVTTGSVSGGMSLVNTSAVTPMILNLTGTGVEPVSFSPTSINFGNVTVGTTSSTQVITVTNFQSTAIPITSVVASGQFISTTGGSIPCGTSVPANSICTLGVQFAPAAVGTVNGALTFSYSGSGSPQEVSLLGTGQ